MNRSIIEEIMETVIITGVGEKDGYLTLVVDYLSDYKNTTVYNILKAKTDSFLKICNEKYNTSEWESFLDKDFKTEIYPLL